MSILNKIVSAVVVATGLSLAAPAVAQPYPMGTAVTYQGRLLDGGLPADDPNGYDFEFTLYDDLAAGSVVAGPITKDDWPVAHGLFTAPLDFGSDVFTGDARWLKIGVRPWDSTGAYTYLDPRQELTPRALCPGPAGPVDGAERHQPQPDRRLCREQRHQRCWRRDHRRRRCRRIVQQRHRRLRNGRRADRTIRQAMEAGRSLTACTQPLGVAAVTKRRACAARFRGGATIRPPAR